jgi:hypothetical protein
MKSYDYPRQEDHRDGTGRSWHGLQMAWGNEYTRGCGVGRPVSRGLHVSTEQSPARVICAVPKAERDLSQGRLRRCLRPFRDDGPVSGDGIDRLTQRVHRPEPARQPVRTSRRWGRQFSDVAGSVPGFWCYGICYGPAAQCTGHLLPDCLVTEPRVSLRGRNRGVPENLLQRR